MPREPFDTAALPLPTQGARITEFRRGEQRSPTPCEHRVNSPYDGLRSDETDRFLITRCPHGYRFAQPVLQTASGIWITLRIPTKPFVLLWLKIFAARANLPGVISPRRHEGYEVRILFQKSSSSCLRDLRALRGAIFLSLRLRLCRTPGASRRNYFIFIW